MTMAGLKKVRLDYFLLWGHALKDAEEILSMIRKDPMLWVIRLHRYAPKRIETLVKAIYSHDYAPLGHLRAKTAYLQSTPPNVLFVFVENKDVQEVLRGNGCFRHIECDRIRAIKDAVRSRFNPVIGGRTSEHHVIHASDHQSQTDHILKFLGLPGGVDELRRPGGILQWPYHIPAPRKYRIRTVSIDALRCSLLACFPPSWTGSVPPKITCLIKESPHYAALVGDTDRYRHYLARARGTLLCDDHSPEHLQRLKKSLQYLEAPFQSEYILTRECPEKGHFVILDGLHRASVLAAQVRRS